MLAYADVCVVKLCRPMQRGIKGKYVATSDTPFYHPRYTAGRVMTRVDLCSIFATAFYTPGVMEVLEAMTMPGTRGQVCVESGGDVHLG